MYCIILSLWHTCIYNNVLIAYDNTTNVHVCIAIVSYSLPQTTIPPLAIPATPLLWDRDGLPSLKLKWVLHVCTCTCTSLEYALTCITYLHVRLHYVPTQTLVCCVVKTAAAFFWVTTSIPFCRMSQQGCLIAPYSRVLLIMVRGGHPQPHSKPFSFLFLHVALLQQFWLWLPLTIE